MKRIVKTLLLDLKFPNAEIVFVFLPPSLMAKHNLNYLKRRGATDVISFPVGEFPSVKHGLAPLGDILICLRIVEQYAKKHGISREEELTRVIIHGVLHLLGYDHDIEKRKRIMKSKEDRLVKLLEAQRAGLWS